MKIKKLIRQYPQKFDGNHLKYSTQNKVDNIVKMPELFVEYLLSIDKGNKILPPPLL